MITWALEHGFSSYASLAQLPSDLQDLPGPGIKPGSPALAGGSLTAGPTGRPKLITFRFEGKKHKPCLEVSKMPWKIAKNYM